MSKTGMLLCVLGAGALAQSPKAPTYDPRLSVHTIVREDIFAGFMAGDMTRMARGEKTVDALLIERPAAKPQLIAWKGSIALARAAAANTANRTAEFETEYKKAQDYFSEALREGPGDNGVQAIFGASHAYFADKLPEAQKRNAWQAAYKGYRGMWQAQSAGVDNMPLHLKGELLAGMAQTAQRTGHAAEAAQFVDRILTTMPNTAYAQVAQKWKDSPEAATKASLLCHSCHEPGRLEARKATLQ
jgi:hypothetical protein